MAETDQNDQWNAVFGRCLAYMCLKDSEYADGQVLEKAKFLERLGLPVKDRAAVIGTTSESLRVLANQQKKAGKKNGKAKRR